MTKLSQQNEVVLPICFTERCPSLPAVVNEIPFQKPMGKKKFLASAVPYLTEQKKLQRVVDCQSSLHGSPNTIAPVRDECAPF